MELAPWQLAPFAAPKTKVAAAPAKGLGHVSRGPGGLEEGFKSVGSWNSVTLKVGTFCCMVCTYLTYVHTCPEVILGVYILQMHCKIQQTLGCNELDLSFV